MAATADRVHHEALTLPAQTLAGWLQGHLSQRVAAYAVGLSDAKLLGRYASGTRTPSSMTLYKMQAAYQAARLLSDAYSDATTQSWFFGTNSRLADRAPSAVLRQAVDAEQMGHVVQAARAFVDADFS